MQYDIIGDVHGYADELCEMLEELGYEHAGNGFTAPPGRQAIFVGDLIDRGPHQQRTIGIVRAMVENGSAQAVMGNHELNAICYFMQRPDGSYLRQHTDNNRKHHVAFLEEFNMNANPDEYADVIEWFKTLPVYLDLGDFRVIHACWHEESLEVVRPFLDDGGRLLPGAYEEYSYDHGNLRKALNVLLKGPEHKLPKGVTFTDAEGTVRTIARIKWWSDQPQLSDRLMDVGDLLTAEQREIIDAQPLKHVFGQVAVPVFMGHYQLSGRPPESVDPSLVRCVDYRKGLTAYSFSSDPQQGEYTYVR